MQEEKRVSNGIPISVFINSMRCLFTTNAKENADCLSLKGLTKAQKILITIPRFTRSIMFSFGIYKLLRLPPILEAQRGMN